ncbi:sorting nexin-22-like isoform X2 [Amphiura filiformis]|uniref:sorting nexin-22-like isoform X2 n=1 Tax=Amphiura filiformis TaxID=82378 RepID=UPI003B220340
MLSVTIPTSKAVVPADERPYTIYQIHVQVSGRSHIVDKRYREFHTMHKQVRKSLGVNTPEFPPKKMWQLSAKGIEQRRQGLENYLQGILNGYTVPKSLLNFLKVKNFKSSSYDSNHWPVMVFDEDSFLTQSSDDSYTDILTDGVTQGLFEDSDSSDPASSGVG